MDIYEQILESDLMDDIWKTLGATDKITLLEKGGWNVVDEWTKRVGENNEKFDV